MSSPHICLCSAFYQSLFLGSGFTNSLSPGSAQSEAGLLTLLRADHHLGNEVDDGARWLLRVVLGKQVTYVVRGSASFPRHKAKDPAGVEQST